MYDCKFDAIVVQESKLTLRQELTPLCHCGGGSYGIIFTNDQLLWSIGMVKKTKKYCGQREYPQLKNFIVKWGS